MDTHNYDEVINELGNLKAELSEFKADTERNQLTEPLDINTKKIIESYSTSTSSDVIISTFVRDNTELVNSNFHKPFFICDKAYTVKSIEMSYTTTCTDGTSGINIEQLTGTTAPGSGNKITSTAVDMTSTINTVYTASLDATYTSLSDGDRLSLRTLGTWTDGEGLTATIVLTPA